MPYLIPVHLLALGQKLYFQLNTLLNTFSGSVELSFEKVKREIIRCNVRCFTRSVSQQCRPQLLSVKFENLVQSIFRNENSTLEINVSHFRVLHWQHWQHPASAPGSTRKNIDMMEKTHFIISPEFSSAWTSHPDFVKSLRYVTTDLEKNIKILQSKLFYVMC